MSEQQANSARSVIEQIWYRARINAFAHRAANREASELASSYFRREVVAVLCGILSIILVYMLSTIESNSWVGVSKLLFTFSSVACTLVSLYYSVMANYKKYNIIASDHEHLLNQYLYIAQRAREVKWPDRPDEDIVALLKDLERDFQLLKATGREPNDRHFEEAHNIVQKIRSDKETQIAQSFEVGKIEEQAQHVGDPTGLRNNE